MLGRAQQRGWDSRTHTEAERGQASTKLVRSQVAWECSLKRGGILHLRLNNDERPIANKYREGKMKRTLKREFKELEVVEMEGIWSTMLLLRIICKHHTKWWLWTSLNNEVYWGRLKKRIKRVSVIMIRLGSGFSLIF